MSIAPPPSFRSGHGRARWVTILLAGGIAGSLASIVSALLQIDLLNRAIAGARITGAAAEANDTRQVFVAVATPIIFLTTALSSCCGYIASAPFCRRSAPWHPDPPWTPGVSRR
jgi:hypothetical protein